MDYKGVDNRGADSERIGALVCAREAGLPHPNQSVYRKNVSSANAIVAIQEVINRLLKKGSKIYMCLYHLQKAFDSVPLEEAIRHWHQIGSVAHIAQLVLRLSMGHHVSPSFVLGRGMQHGCFHPCFYCQWTPS